VSLPRATGLIQSLAVVGMPSFTPRDRPLDDMAYWKARGCRGCAWPGSWPSAPAPSSGSSARKAPPARPSWPAPARTWPGTTTTGPN